MFKVKNSLTSLALLLLASNANASPLTDALIERPGFTYNPSNSYDGPGRDSLSFFSSFTDGKFYQLGTIAAQSTSFNYSASLVSELAAFSGDDANFQGAFTNKFGYENIGDTFAELIDSDNKNPLSEAGFTQVAGQDFNFALESPEGLFYGKDSLNLDGGVAHMIGLKVTTAGTVNLGETTLFGNGPLSFNLEVGDIILFIEDMKAAGNLALPLTGDFDYNDMVMVLRASSSVEVPEPATIALLAFGMLGGVMRRKRNCEV